ncbi:MAG TPA: histidine kinase [Bacteroidales bacterium]|nr:MAG: hypothetical protein A2X01_10770 [Bacteroidetes bacterium GWF2_35_48]HBX50411.1 histidine kinase [Bacteroidales bacterium]
MSRAKISKKEAWIFEKYSVFFNLSLLKRRNLIIYLLFCIIASFASWLVMLAAGTKPIAESHSLLLAVDFVFMFLLLLIIIYTILLLRKNEEQNIHLYQELNQKKNTINKNAEFAKKIGEGDFSTTLSDIAESDVLGRSLVIMRDNLLMSKTKETEENWISRGKDVVSNELRINNEIDLLSYHVLVKIIEYTNLIQGAFYIFDDEMQILECTATYAYGRKKYRKQRFRIGQGLIGQAAYEMDTIYRKEIPEDYITISSGILGDKKPGSILIIPLISDERLHGAVELASIQNTIPALTIRFVQELSSIIARTVFNLKVSLRTEKLLREAQQMTEELQENEDKLRENAEEMKTAQEDLEKMNRNLESKILEIENSEKRLHSLLENASEVISIFSPDGVVVYESPSSKNILGYDSTEIIGTDGFTRIDPKQSDVVQLVFAKLLKNPEKSQTFEFKYTKKDGTSVWLQSIGRNLLRNQAIGGLIFNTRDITLEKIAEKEQRMRSRMQSLSENSPDMILRLGLLSEIFYVNPKVEIYTGIKPNDFIGKSFFETDLHTDYIEMFRDLIEQIKTKSEKQSFEKALPTPHGEKIMLVNAIPEFSEEAELETILIVAHDITISKMIEREIQDKNKKITESINYAYRIQSAILPEQKLLRHFFPNSFILYEPRDVVSGDFPWFFTRGNNVYVGAVDCTGHGVPGALLSIIGYFSLNNIVDHERVLPAGEILDNLHANVRRSLKQDKAGAESHDGMDIAFCKINKNEKKLEFAGAHRPLYLLRNGELIQFKGSPKAIGGIPIVKKQEKKFETHFIDIQKGDRIFIFSDGLQDQINDKKEKYSPARIRELIIKNQTDPISNLYNAFFKDFHLWRGKVNQIDDILLIGIEF